MSFTHQMGALRNSLNDTKQRTNQAVKRVKRDVKEMRADNINSQKALREDFNSASRVFWGKQKRQEKKEEEPRTT